MKIDPFSKLVMIGDSITDCGRNYRSTSEEALGNGYVRLVYGLLTATNPESRIQIVNSGIGGDTVRDLKKRWQRDVLDLKPNWLSIMIGINDVWQQFGGWLPEKEWVSTEEYDRTLGELIGATSPSLDGLILMTPYHLQFDTSDPLRVRMDCYGDVVRQYANKYGAIFINTQAVFDEVLINTAATDLSEDRVHLNTTGHMILARAFLKAIGYSWDS